MRFIASWAGRVWPGLIVSLVCICSWLLCLYLLFQLLTSFPAATTRVLTTICCCKPAAIAGNSLSQRYQAQRILETNLQNFCCHDEWKLLTTRHLLHTCKIWRLLSSSWEWLLTRQHRVWMPCLRSAKQPPGQLRKPQRVLLPRLPPSPEGLAHARCLQLGPPAAWKTRPSFSETLPLPSQWTRAGIVAVKLQ